jgi:hypothetical protein
MAMTVTVTVFKYHALSALKLTHAFVRRRCPPGVCLGNSTCLQGHEGPVCSLCSQGYALQSGRCRECGSLGVWPQLIAALLGLVVLVFLIFFSWFPLFPEWLQTRLTFATTFIANQSANQAEEETPDTTQDNKKKITEGLVADSSKIAVEQATDGDQKSSVSKVVVVLQSAVDTTLSIFGDNVRDYFKILIGFWSVFPSFNPL